MLTPYFARAEYIGLLDIWTAGRPGTTGWWRRIKSRANFAAVITGTLTAAGLAEMRGSGEKIRSRVEARREEYLRSGASRPA